MQGREARVDNRIADVGKRTATKLELFGEASMQDPPNVFRTLYLVTFFIYLTYEVVSI